MPSNQRTNFYHFREIVRLAEVRGGRARWCVPDLKVWRRWLTHVGSLAYGRDVKIRVIYR
jgi:hypothetical protein